MADSDSKTSDFTEDDLRSIEDELFDLEDELIEMQGTTIRTFEQEDEEFEGLQDFYLYAKEQEEDEEDTATDDLELSERLERLIDTLGDQKEVKPGQLLMADLRGEGIDYRPGQFVHETDRGRRFFAARSGRLSLSGDTIHVLGVKRIEGDLDRDTGDVRYDGSVLVEGSVADNRLIEATGNVWIHGGVGKSNISAGGDVIVQGGIMTGNRCLLEAHGNVYARFVENSQIETTSSLLVREIIMHSSVNVDQDIILIDDDGAIVGGEVEAGRRIITHELGSVSYPETTVRMAAAGALQEEFDQLNEKIRRLEKKEENQDKNVQNLLTKKNKEGLSPKDEDRLRNLRFELNHLRQDLQEVEMRMEKIKEELESDLDREILVSGTAFPNVKIHMGSALTEIEEEKNKCCINEENGEISFDNYRSVDFDLDLDTDIEPQHMDMDKDSLPGMDELRRHIKFQEKQEPLLNRKAQFRHFLGLQDDSDLALIDITKEEEPSGQNDEPVDREANSKQSDQPDSQNQDEESAGHDETARSWWAIEVRPEEREVDVRRYYTAKSTDSVRVRCETVREGVERAAEYFDVEPGDLGVKILEEGQSGYFGTSIGKKKYLIRAVKRSALEEQQDDPELEGMDILDSDQDEDDVAGFINLDNTMDGLMLTVYPPKGNGLPVEFDSVKEDLEEEEFTQEIDWPLVEETIEEAAGEPVKIGPRQRDPEIDGSYSVTVNEAETEAYLLILPPKEEGIPVTIEEVISHLENEDIRYDKQVVETVFQQNNYDEEVMIAEGRSPVHGRDGWVEMKVEADFSDADAYFIDDPDQLIPSHGDEDQDSSKEGIPVKKVTVEQDREPEDQDPKENQRVDYRATDKISSVQENELIAELHEPRMGEPGETVRGEQIPAIDGEEVNVQAGENTLLSGDAHKVSAEREGKVILQGNQFLVEPVLVVDGDLDYETGNVDFDGVVIVEGFVHDGFKIKAGRRIEAEAVGKARLESGGNVIIEKGMAGKEKGVIEAEGNIYAKFLENTRARATGSIVIEKSIMHSYVDAGEYVIVDGKKRGNILGGAVRAGKGISVKGMGSSMTSQTEVAVGITPKIRDHIEELEQEIDEQKEKFEKIRLGLKGIREQAEEVGGIDQLPEAKQQKQEQLSNVARSIKFKIEGLGSELKDLRNEIQSSQGGEILVEDVIHPGVKITIQTASLHVTETYNHVRYALENGEVVQMEYVPLEVDIERPDQ